MHFVPISMHRLTQPEQAMHQWIARDVQQCTFAVLHAPYQGVAECVALEVAVADRILDQFDDTARQRARSGTAGNLFAEQGLGTCRIPCHLLWRYLRCQKPAGRIPEASEVRTRI
jgi:hypothetical protein